MNTPSNNSLKPLTILCSLSTADALRLGHAAAGTCEHPLVGVLPQLDDETRALLVPTTPVRVWTRNGNAPLTITAPATDAEVLRALGVYRDTLRDAVLCAADVVGAAACNGQPVTSVRTVVRNGNAVCIRETEPASEVVRAVDTLRHAHPAFAPLAERALTLVKAAEEQTAAELDAEVQGIAAGITDYADIVVPATYGIPALRELEAKAREASETRNAARKAARDAARDAERNAIRAYALTVGDLAPGAEAGYDMAAGVATHIARRVEAQASTIPGIREVRVYRQGDSHWSDVDPPEARTSPLAAHVVAQQSLAAACEVLARGMFTGGRIDVSPVGRIADPEGDDGPRTGFTVLVTSEHDTLPKRLVVCYCE